MPTNAELEIEFIPRKLGGALMTPERVSGSTGYDVMETALHDEIKQRAYELYERQYDDIHVGDLRNELQFELPRVVYAAAQVQMSNREIGDNRTVRAARIYLRALSSYLSQSGPFQM